MMSHPNPTHQQAELTEALQQMNRISMLSAKDKEMQQMVQPYFISCMIKLLESQLVQEQQKIVILSLVGKIVNQIGQSLQCQNLTSLMFNLLFNWKIEGKVKYLLKRPLKQIVREFLGSYAFFEEVYYKIINLSNLYKIQHVKHEVDFRIEVQPPGFQNHYRLSIIFPRNYINLQYILTLLAESLFIESPTGGSQQESKDMQLISSIKTIHMNVFNKIEITQNLGLFDNLMDLWTVMLTNMEHNLIIQKYEIQKMAAWRELPTHFEMIFNENARKVNEKCEVYNYLLFEKSWQDKNSKKLSSLKENALKLFSEYISLMSVNYANNGLQYVQPTQTIRASLQESILYMTHYFNCLSQEQEYLGRQALGLLCSLIEIEGQIDFESVKALFEKMTIPLMNSCLQNYSLSYSRADEYKEFYLHLKDCAEDQNSETVMSALCRLTEICVDKCQAFYYFLRDYIKESLIINNKRADLFYLLQKNVDNTRAYLSNEFCLLMSTLLCCYTHKKSQDLSWLSLFLSADYVHSITEYELVYVYLLLTYEWESIFPQLDQRNQLFFLWPLQTQSVVLQHVGLQFVFNQKEAFYSANFLEKLMNVFSKLKDDQFKWVLLNKFVKKFIGCFSDQRLSQLIMNFKQRMLSIASLSVAVLQSDENSFDSTELYQLLSFCRTIARDHKNLRDKYLVIHQLFDIVSHIRLMSRFYIDDEVVLIAGELLECVMAFPPNFEAVLQEVVEVFRNSEFQGNGYYHLFSCCLGIICQYHHSSDSQLPNCFYMIYSAVEEGIAYLTYYPQKFTIDLGISLSSHMVIMQIFYLSLGSCLSKLQATDIISICDQVLKNFKGNDQMSRILSARATNLKLICDIQLRNTINYYEILCLVRDKIFYTVFDSCLLLFLLKQIMLQLSAHHNSSLLVLVYLLKQNEEASRKWQGASGYQQNKKLNTIRNYIELPITLEATIQLQSIQLIKKMKETSQVTFQAAKQQYLKTFQGQAQKLRYLQQLQQEYAKKRVFADGIQQMQRKLKEHKAANQSEAKYQEEAVQRLLEGEAPLRRKNRKILKISDNRIREEGQEEKYQEPQKLKRKLQSLEECNQELLQYFRSCKRSKRQSQDKTCGERLMQKRHSKQKIQ